MSKDNQTDSHVHEWGYTKKESLNPKEFGTLLAQIFENRKIVSVGEAHDENEDTSFSWILAYEDEIIQAYRKYGYLSQVLREVIPQTTFKECLEPRSRLIEEVQKHRSNFEDLLKYHPSRMFSLVVLPIARLRGFTDLVLEGFNETNTAEDLKRSKDRIGQLLQIFMAMMLGIRIHGAYSDGILSTPVDIAEALGGKVEKVISEHPNAKVIVYNGAVHNMTEPFKGEIQLMPGISFDTGKMTYAPQFIEKYGDQYASMDLLYGEKPLPDSHFKGMQERSGPGITAFTHGADQVSFILKSS